MPIPPPTIGRYEVQRVLGRGAMGVVYLARDPLLKRPVAVKIVHSLSEDRATLLLRFQREAEISARLNHPNIVMVFDVGEDAYAGPFMAMEYVDGTLLSQLVRDGLDQEALLHLLIQAAAALKASGEAGIAHRDVKPDNMIVSRDGRLKLMDFGIARAEESRLTQAGMVFGTPSYTAPELLVGGEASPATDRWAFTISAFEVLTGALPFHGMNVGATLYSIVHEGPRIPPGWPQPFHHVFQKAFAKAPGDRHPDLEAFLRDLLDALPLREAARQRLQAYVAGDLPFAWTSPFAPPVPIGPPDPHPEPLPLELNPAPPATLGPRPWFRAPWGIGTLALAGLAALILVVAGFRWREPWILEVATTPPSADLMVDGRYQGQTPLGVRLPKGQNHIIRVERAGFESITREVRPGEWSLQFVLRRAPYPISIVTDPAGAEVFLDGQGVGTTPLWALPVPADGLHELRIRKKGYQEWYAMLEKDVPFPSVVHLNPGR
jgi:serine/threonine-protein kinase